MAYTRQVTLPRFEDRGSYLLFRHLLGEAANKSIVGVYVHEDVKDNLGITAAVDVWSDNQGSVDNFCEFFLGKISENNLWYSLIAVSERYEER